MLSTPAVSLLFDQRRGGITHVYDEYEGHYNRERVMKQTERIDQTAPEVFEVCDDSGLPPQQAAIRMAEQSIQVIGNNKLSL